MQTQFPSSADLDHIYMLVRNMTDRLYPTVQYKVLTMPPGEIDPVHLEIDDESKQFSDPVLLRGFVQPNQETHPLTRFGIEKVRDTVLSVSVPHLLDAGFITQDSSTREISFTGCGVGDRFVFSTLIYDVNEIRRGKMWANTDIPVFFEFLATRYRPESELNAGI